MYMNSFLKRIAVALLLISTVTVPLFSASVRLRVQMPRGSRSIEVGQSFYISYEVVDSDVQPERPSNVPGATLLYFDRTGQSSSYSSVNGKVSQTFSYTYTATLKAKTEGTFTFGPVSVGGEKSNTVTYTIGKASNAASAGSNAGPGASQQGDSRRQDSDKPQNIGKGDQNLFLRANVSKANVFEQEALVYTVKLYTTYDAIKFIGATAAPKFDGFVVEESKDISNSLSYETYQGKTYATAIIARYIIFPQMTGQLKVTGNTYTVSVDRREYFHDSFWGNMSYTTPLQLNVTPNDLVVSVKSLPTPRPADFCGGVGSFSIESDLNAKDLKSNQAASIVYKIKGTGNLKYVQMPDLQALYPSELEVYSPQSKQNVSVGSSNVSGVVTFDYSFVPLEEGDYQIPEVRITYFNPASGKYESSVAKGYKITVGKGKTTSEALAGKPLHFESDWQVFDEKQLSQSMQPLVTRWVYWLIYIIPSILLLIAVIAYRRYAATHADMQAFNSRRADKLAKRRLRRAYSAMSRNDKEAFDTELLKALWGYIADKLKMPTSELLRDNIRQVLNDRGIPAGDIDSFVELLDEVEFSKYSSSESEFGMKVLYEKAISVINSFENEFKRLKSK